ncbi:MAG: hypothetical protein KF726_11990 [Anaerolineae bacterium]|nr:hypothetical protein [Anaerolineae bacterium]
MNGQFFESLRTNRLRFGLIILILTLLPCYCVGGVLLLVSNSYKPAASPTLKATDVAQAITATSMTALGTPTPLALASITPIQLAPTPTQIGLPTTSIGTPPPFSTFDTRTLFPDDGGIGSTPVLTPGNVGGSPLSSCPDVDGTTTTLIRTSASGATAPGATIFCRSLPDPNSIGIASVLQRGVVVAVEIYAFNGSGVAVTRFSEPMQVCLLGEGVFLFLDANNAPRSAQQLPASADGGYLCASVPNAGTAVLTYR